MPKSKEAKMENIELTSPVNKNYEKFFNQFNELSTLIPSQYKVVHLIGYFCKKYKEKYNLDYKFKYNVAQPSKCFEVFQIKKLGQIVSSDPQILVSYIDWIFDNKVQDLKKRFTSISYLTTEKFTNEFKVKYEKGEILFAASGVSGAKHLSFSNISRSDVLDKSVKEILSPIKVFNTYGDLAFFYLIYKSGNTSIDIKCKFDRCVEELSKIGFDIERLDRVK